MRSLQRTWPFHIMLLPAIIFLIVFSYIPMGGIVMAFQNYKPWLGITGSEWVGLDNFRFLFQREDSLQVVWNTLIIAVLKMFFNLVVPFVFAILLNEIRKVGLQRSIQTLVYLPHFLSWVILGGILIDLLASDGFMNRILGSFGIQPIFFWEIITGFGLLSLYRIYGRSSATTPSYFLPHWRELILRCMRLLKWMERAAGDRRYTSLYLR